MVKHVKTISGLPCQGHVPTYYGGYHRYDDEIIIWDSKIWTNCTSNLYKCLSTIQNRNVAGGAVVTIREMDKTDFF